MKRFILRWRQFWRALHIAWLSQHHIVLWNFGDDALPEIIALVPRYLPMHASAMAWALVDTSRMALEYIVYKTNRGVTVKIK